MSHKTEDLIYILTNPSFPNYVKIGKTNNLERRIKELNNPTCLPFSFRAYATYKVEKGVDSVEKSIHRLIDHVDYELRAREEVDAGRLREREFFAMDAEKAFDILSEVALLRGDEHNLSKRPQTKQEKVEEQVAKEVEDKQAKLNQSKTLRHAFWKQFLPEFKKHSQLFDGRTVDNNYDNNLNTGSGINGTRYTVSINYDHVAVYLVLEREQEWNKKAFEELHKYKKEIEASFGEPLIWQRLDHIKKSQVYIRNNKVGLIKQEQWAEINKFFVETMTKFYSVFKPYIEKMKAIK